MIIHNFPPGGAITCPIHLHQHHRLHIQRIRTFNVFSSFPPLIIVWINNHENKELSCCENKYFLPGGVYTEHVKASLGQRECQCCSALTATDSQTFIRSLWSTSAPTQHGRSHHEADQSVPDPCHYPVCGGLCRSFDRERFGRIGERWVQCPSVRTSAHFAVWV